VLNSRSPYHLTGEISLLNEHWNLRKPLEVELDGGGTTGCITKGNLLAPSFVLKNIY
jgi:hypothetical protein